MHILADCCYFDDMYLSQFLITLSHYFVEGNAPMTLPAAHLISRYPFKTMFDYILVTGRDMLLYD